MDQRLKGIRGATCSDNTKEEISKYVCQMVNEIIEKNNIDVSNIVSIQFTMTNDLDALNPATAIRTGNLHYDVSHVPLFCSAEPYIKGGMEYVIRCLVLCYMNEYSETQNIYINGAQRLRPDFFKK